MNTDSYSTSLSPPSIEAVENFAENMDIPRLKQNLRKVLFEYLRLKHDDLIPDFEHFIEDMNFLFHLMDMLENADQPGTEKGI